MKRGILLVIVALLAHSSLVLAQTSPSIFTSPSAVFAEVQRVIMVPFAAAQTVQDQFAATKATDLLGATLAARNIRLVSWVDLIRRMQEDTGRTFSNPPTKEDQQLFLSELPKYIDAAILGNVSAWGTITVESTGVISIPVYGWGSGSGSGAVYGPGGSATIAGSWSSSWQSTTPVPIRVTNSASIVGATIALVRVRQDQSVALFWQYTHVALDRGGPFIWNRPAPPDKLAEQFFTDVAKAWPVK